MFVVITLHDYAGDNPEPTSGYLPHGDIGRPSHVRRRVLRVRRDWLPPDQHRETVRSGHSIIGVRDYVLDLKASRDGRIVYRQVDPRLELQREA